MNDPPNNPLRYRVSYSGRVREAAGRLIHRAAAIGLGRKVREAIFEIDRLLQIYPQFGQPLRDVAGGQAQLWVGVVPPLVVHYLINETQREVLIVLPIKPFPRTGL